MRRIPFRQRGEFIAWRSYLLMRRTWDGCDHWTSHKTWRYA